jgi:hypothetical protein
MPNMAKTPKRPRDPNQLAKMIVDIATEGWEITALTRTEIAQKAARSRASKLTPKERSSIAQKAAQTRWTKATVQED